MTDAEARFYRVIDICAAAIIQGLILFVLLFFMLVGLLGLLDRYNLMTPEQFRAVVGDFPVDRDIILLSCMAGAFIFGAVRRGHRWAKYVGVTTMGALVGLALVWFMERLAANHHNPSMLGTNQDYRTAACIVAAFSAAAVCRSAYKRHELLPLAVIYVAGVGSVVGCAIGAAIILGWAAFEEAMPHKIEVGLIIVSAFGGLIINLLSKYGRDNRPLGTARLGYFWSRGILGDYLVHVLGGFVGIILGAVFLYHLIPFALKFAATDGFSKATSAIWFFLIIFGWLFAQLGLSAIRHLYDLLFGPLKSDNPLQDEQAHGRAGRARPDQTARGAIGNSQREPVHAQRFRD